MHNRNIRHIIHRDTVKPEWVDYNGHLRDAFYMLIFSLATDGFMDRIGLDEAGRAAKGRSLFTLEAHINYLHEIKEGAEVRVEASVLAFDAKRVHLYMEMFSGDGEGAGENDGTEPVAASEQMLLHVDMTNGAKSAVFDTDIAGRIEAMFAGSIETPRYAGRVIGLPSKSRASTSSASGDATRPA